MSEFRVFCFESTFILKICINVFELKDFYFGSIHIFEFKDFYFGSICVFVYRGFYYVKDRVIERVCRQA